MKKQVVIVFLALGAAINSYAGNPDRSGSAGAGHLLINPWARSAGLSNSAMASINGVEATFLNVAGLAFVRKTELLFSNNQYLVGTGIKINAFGFGQKIGETGSVGLTVSNMSFGDIPITKETLPEGGIGSFSPSYTNIGLSYAKGFSNSIYGGLTVRLISEAIYNVRSQGVSFDAGIRYITGENDNVRFGISLRNVGPPMRYRGDGLTVTATIPTNGTSLTVEQRADKYELPSLVNVGFAYDFLLSEKMKLTGNLQYTSNSFTRDQFGLGVDFDFRERLIVRAGYQWQKDMNDADARSSVFVGPAGGLTLQLPTGENGTIIGLDYSYRVTNPFSGVHSIGVHLAL
ncbi:MAG: PorV/PorQ family protein [Crocinitomicaceae bacterium]|nr:PorV/PorQ family protein [Crocinitomicaceae bacterium]